MSTLDSSPEYNTNPTMVTRRIKSSKTIKANITISDIATWQAKHELTQELALAVLLCVTSN
uniref:Uncharacterized protein n=1 Tax=Anguilla anguilla TaxID=7936 RepID=A0A0E9PU44_ANGAN